MVLLLIGILKLRFGSKLSPDKKFVKLMEYVNEKVGAYLDREMIIAHKFLSNPKTVAMLNRINKGMKSTKLRKKIENIAWDLTVPRVLEFCFESGIEGRYFLPFFLSYDKELKDALKLYSVKGVIVDKETSRVIPLTEITNVEYYKANNCHIDFEVLFSKEVIEHRRNVTKHNKEDGFAIIESEFDELKKIMDCK